MSRIPENVAKREFGLINVESEFAKLKGVITSHFDERVWFLTEACLSVIASLMLKDLPNPIGLNIVDSPSSEKTTVLGFFYDLPIVYRSDDFSPASFVTQAAKVGEKKLKNVDLLPRIRHKCLVVPELAPMFGADKDELLRNFSMLTRVFDGEGLMRDGGVHGRRGYEGDYHFAWLGATTPIKPHVWKLMGHLGSRFLFLTANSSTDFDREVDQAVNSILSDTPYKEKVALCRQAITEFIELRALQVGGKQFYRSVDWNRRTEKASLVKHLAKLAELTGRIRSTVSVWGTDGHNQNQEIDFSIPMIERPMRLVSVLYGLARGHALVSGRSQLSEADMPLIVTVALSSMPDDRRRVLDLMIEPHHPDKTTGRGVVTSSEVEELLGFSRPTARKVLNTLSILGIGDLSDSVGSLPLKLTLKPHYDWITTDDFQKYRQSWDQADEDDEGIPF